MKIALLENASRKCEEADGAIIAAMATMSSLEISTLARARVLLRQAAELVRLVNDNVAKEPKSSKESNGF